MRKATIPITVLAALLLGTALAVAYSSNPPEETTGAPDEFLCDDCHDTYALNQSGVVELVDAPALYRAGHTYRIKVRITSSNTAGDASRRWGFELTAIHSGDGTGAGTFANVAGQGTAIASGSGALSTRRYVGHTDSKTGAASPVEWAFDWTAPAAGNIPVMFYVAGVAANGAQGTNGDWVFSNTWSAADTTTDVRETTWGEVKARYRR
jgi:hypothetical protein